MDINAPVFKLQLITLLDSISYGLIYCFLTPYVIYLGADQFIAGILAVGNLICNLLSADIINCYAQIHGKRYTLYVVLSIAMVSHLMMVLTNSYWFTIFARYIFSLTNQSQNLCKSLVLQRVPQDEQEHSLTTFNMLSSAGYIIGPLISGCLYESGFGYICLTAAILTFINTILITTIPIETEEPSPRSDGRTMVEKTQSQMCDVISNFANCEHEKNWDIIAVKYLYMCSVTIFSNKFTQILKNNFQASSLLIGYTYAYMNSITFAGTYFVNNIRNKYSPDTSVITLIEYTLIVSGISLLIACYSPVFLLYEIMCIPIIFATNFLNSSWNDFFSVRGNDSLTRMNNVTGIVVGLTVPLIFGIVCNVIGHHATILFTVGPVFASLYVINKYTKHVLPREGADKNKDN